MGNNQNGLPLIPQIPLVDVVEVLETRNLNFNKEFSFDYCDEVAQVGHHGRTPRCPTSQSGSHVLPTGFARAAPKVALWAATGFGWGADAAREAASCG